MSKITIIIPSYNKVKYIAEALDSVFMQETNYSYKVIVTDDGSDDGTLGIVDGYRRKYLDKIEVLPSSQHQGLYRNILKGYEKLSKSDYFCVLDPDDFWIDKHKLQKSVDFLENNKEFTIYVTNTIMLMPDGTQKEFINRKSIADFNFYDFLEGKHVSGCTLGSVFRNVIFKNGIPDKMLNLENLSQEQSFRGDTFRTALHLHEGKIHAVPEVDGVYRITKEGIYQGLSSVQQELLNAVLFRDLWLYFEKKYPQLLCIARNFYPTNSDKVLQELVEKDDMGKVSSLLSYMRELKKVFLEHQSVIQNYIQERMSIKNRIRLLVYNRLKNQLSKKGFI